jgi:biopolymer transport protein TolQ
LHWNHTSVACNGQVQTVPWHKTIRLGVYEIRGGAMSHFSDWSPAHIFHAMGPFARTIVILLFIMFARAALVALDRFLRFAQARRQTQAFVRLAAEPLRDGDLAEARRIAEGKGKSHVARIVAAGIRAFTSAPLSFSQSEKVAAARRDAWQAATLNRAEFNHRLSGLGTIASTAPFVGLLGTVVGIVDSFKATIGSHAMGLAVVGAGIAEALVTTALGLIVAIPAVWCFNYFTEKLNVFTVEMNTSSLELVTYLAIHLGQNNVRE